MRSVLLFGMVCAALLPASNVMDEIRQGSFAARVPARQQLNVLDWNIDRGTHLDRIASAMESQKPDLMILQEVDLNARRSNRLDVSQQLAKRLGVNYVFAPEFQELGQGSTGDPAYHGQAILTSLPVRSTRILRFQNQSGFWKPHRYVPSWGLFQRRLGGRLALIAELEFNGRPLVVYNLHLESRSAGRLQLAQLDEVIADAARYPQTTPIVIAGDFNTKYRHSTREIVDALTRAGYQNAFGDRQQRTHWLIGALDYIFVRGPIRLSEVRVRKDLHGSDHFPISAQLTSTSQVAAR